MARAALAFAMSANEMFSKAPSADNSYKPGKYTGSRALTICIPMKHDMEAACLHILPIETF